MAERFRREPNGGGTAVQREQRVAPAPPAAQDPTAGTEVTAEIERRVKENPDEE
jgi:hypothetical protein